MTKASELVQRWQEDRSNFHRDTICEIVEDYEEWRSSALPPSPHAPDEDMVERLARHLAKREGEDPEEPLYHGSETLAWHAWVDEARADLAAAFS